MAKMDERNGGSGRLVVLTGSATLALAVTLALLAGRHLRGDALAVLLGMAGGMGVTVLVSLLVAALSRRRRARRSGVLVEYVRGGNPAEPIRLSQIPPLTDAESGLAEEAYRRGYRDGWIQAAETMYDLMSDRQLPLQAAYDACWNHWMMTLLPWRLGGHDRSVLPPAASQGSPWQRDDGPQEVRRKEL
jgi:hypothetical protein